MDECKVVEVRSGGKVGPPRPHEEVDIGQVRKKPAAHKEGAHGFTIPYALNPI